MAQREISAFLKNAANPFWKRGLFPLFLPLCLVLLSFAIVIRMLLSDWMIDPQYSYGFLVPLLAVGLLWRRLKDVPAPIYPSLLSLIGGDLVGLLSTGGLLLLIPFAEANPDWRILGIVATFCALGVTFAVLLHLGGWPWVKHFGFPICFILIADPWTRNFEKEITSFLVSWNADAAIEILHWWGYEAARQGNLILLPVGVLGMEEACSGIQSLQGGLMVALFFGEYFRLKVVRRLLLLLVAVVGAMFGNMLRSSFLAFVASSRGLSEVHHWHDPAGLLVLLIAVASVACCSFLWREKKTSTPTASDKRGNFSKPLSLGNKSMAFFGMLFLLLILSLAGSEYWFRSHELAMTSSVNWDLQARTQRGVFPVTVSTETSKLLFNPDGFSEKWVKKSGEHGQVFYFRWPTGRIAVQSIVAMHNPLSCLTNIGMKRLGALASIHLEKKGISLDFRGWLFEQDGNLIYVYHATPMDSQIPASVLESLNDSPQGRFKSLLIGMRNRGQRMVEVAFWNLPDELAARDALSRYLDEAVVRHSPQSPISAIGKK